MRTQEFVGLSKRVVEAGRWSPAGTGKVMPKAAFPLSRSRSFQLGRSWAWRVDRVAGGGVEGRLLTAFEPIKEKALAWLSVERPDGCAIVARYEYHGFDEPGWHCHALCSPLSSIPVAIVKPYGTIRIPAARSRHRRISFVMTEAGMLATAFKFFRVTDKPQDAWV